MGDDVATVDDATPDGVDEGKTAGELEALVGVVDGDVGAGADAAVASADARAAAMAAAATAWRFASAAGDNPAIVVGVVVGVDTDDG